MNETTKEIISESPVVSGSTDYSGPVNRNKDKNRTRVTYADVVKHPGTKRL